MGGLIGRRPTTGHWVQYVRNTTDRSSGDSATTATGHEICSPSGSSRATYSTTARPPVDVAATVPMFAWRAASMA